MTNSVRHDLPFIKRKQELSRQLAKLAAIEPVEYITEQLDRVTVAFAGLGMVVRPARTPRMREPTASELLDDAGIRASELQDDGAIGDLSYCFFDKNGNQLKDDWTLFLTAGHYSDHKGVEFYRQMVKDGKRVILIAGPFKIAAIRAAMKGKLFNVWFTDEDTARKVLEKP